MIGLDGHSTAKTLTVISVLMIMAGGYTLLQWSESESLQGTIGTETLRIDYEAPARSDRGPWQEGHVFDSGSLGVPVDLAPEWNITAEYLRTGPPEDEGAWSAQAETRSRGPGGRAWWAHTVSIEPISQGDRAHMVLNMSSLVLEAQRMHEESGVNGQIQIEVRVHHVSTVQTSHGEATAQRTARLVIQPQSDVLVVEAHDDRAVYQAPETKDLPVPAAALTAMGIASAVGALTVQSRTPTPPFKGAVTARSLKVPPDAVVLDLQDLVRISRDRQVPVFFDPEQETYVVLDQTPMVAHADPEAKDKENDPLRERDPSPHD